MINRTESTCGRPALRLRLLPACLRGIKEEGKKEGEEGDHRGDGCYGGS